MKSLVFLSLIFATPGFSQAPQITHYPDSAMDGSNVPSFKGTVVAFRFTGSVQIEIQKVLMKQLGLRDVANRCDIPGQPIICISVERLASAPTSSYGNSSFSGSGGSVSSNDSISGNEVFVAVHVDIVSNKSVQQIAVSTGEAFAGQSYDSGSTSSARFGSSSFSSNVTPEQFAFGAATRKAAMKLFENNWHHPVLHLDATTQATWIPGAAELVAQAFHQSTHNPSK